MSAQGYAGVMETILDNYFFIVSSSAAGAFIACLLIWRIRASHRSKADSPWTGRSLHGADLTVRVKKLRSASVGAYPSRPPQRTPLSTFLTSAQDAVKRLASFRCRNARFLTQADDPSNTGAPNS